MTQTKSALKGVRIMMPYDTYRLYQAERVKSSAEIQPADMQAARLVSAVASLFRSITRPVRAVRRLGPSAVRGSLSAPQWSARNRAASASGSPTRQPTRETPM